MFLFLFEKRRLCKTLCYALLPDYPYAFILMLINVHQPISALQKKKKKKKNDIAYTLRTKRPFFLVENVFLYNEYIKLKC
jgi:hypothetical protein